jgi:threonine dehydrogenase-like Zn-dependent dehydrogenase
VLASVLLSPRNAVVREAPSAELAPGQVRVRLQGAGICASELPLWEGREWFEYPRAPGEPGHEGWGEVAEVGRDVAGLSLGQRVAMIGERVHAELAVADAAQVVALPEAIAPELPFPGEPLACAVNAMRRAHVGPGDRVAVVGCGFLGLALVQLCAGIADQVIAISRRDTGRSLATALGAGRSFRYDDAALGGEPEFDVVFEATGYQQPLDLAARLVRTRGRLIIAGYHQDGRRTVDMQLWNWRGLDVINAHERDAAIYVEGLREAVRAVVEGRLDPRPLLTHSFALEEIAEAYRVSAARPEGFIKAVWRRD